MGVVQRSVPHKQARRYLPRGENTLHTIFARHFTDFLSRYDEEYADTFGKFRLERIQAVGEHFLTCSDYQQGITRIRCSNPNCGLVGASHLLDHATGSRLSPPFLLQRVLSVPPDAWATSPSCSQKRTLLFAEHLSEEVLLRPPHQQFVFTFPKVQRVFFRHDRKLFAEISKMIFAMISDFYREVVGKEIRMGMVIAHLRLQYRQQREDS